MKKFAPKPYQVRAQWKNYLALSAHYLERLKTGKFNPSGTGSRAYYERAMAHYQDYFSRWGHLLGVRLQPKKRDVTY